jgi:transposase-like protein
VLRCFAQDLTATDSAQLTGLSVRAVNTIFLKIRQRIAPECERLSPCCGDIEVDESYFGPRRIRGKRGRGAGSKTIVFGLLQRHGKVHTEIVPNCSKPAVQQVIRGRVHIDSVIHSDGWRGYDGLVDVGYAKHFRVDHADSKFAQGSRNINGIESFWSFAKRRLVKFNGVPAKTFYLHLKETEFRFNYRTDNLYTTLLKLLRNNPV